MPLSKKNQTVFHRTLYAGQLYSVTLLKRNNDQQEGTVTAYQLFQCRRGAILRTGEPISGDETSDSETTWFIPQVELNRVGVAHINAADRIVDEANRTWQPESTTIIEEKLFSDQVKIRCLRVDP